MPGGVTDGLAPYDSLRAAARQHLASACDPTRSRMWCAVSRENARTPTKVTIESTPTALARLVVGYLDAVEQLRSPRVRARSSVHRRDTRGAGALQRSAYPPRLAEFPRAAKASPRRRSSGGSSAEQIGAIPAHARRMKTKGGNGRGLGDRGGAFGTPWLAALTALSVGACACSGESSEVSQGARDRASGSAARAPVAATPERPASPTSRTSARCAPPAQDRRRLSHGRGLRRRHSRLQRPDARALLYAALRPWTVTVRTARPATIDPPARITAS